MVKNTAILQRLKDRPRPEKASGNYPGILAKNGLEFHDDPIIMLIITHLAVSSNTRKHAEYVLYGQKTKDILDLGSFSGSRVELIATYLMWSK